MYSLYFRKGPGCTVNNFYYYLHYSKAFSAEQTQMQIGGCLDRLHCCRNWEVMIVDCKVNVSQQSATFAEKKSVVNWDKLTEGLRASHRKWSFCTISIAEASVGGCVQFGAQHFKNGRENKGKDPTDSNKNDLRPRKQDVWEIVGITGTTKFEEMIEVDLVIVFKCQKGWYKEDGD